MTITKILSNAIILFFILSWIATIILYQVKKKHFDAGSVLLFSYLLYAVMSLILFNNPYYSFNEMSIFPFIYLYLMLMLAFSPVLRYDYNKIDEIQKPPTIFLNLVCIIFIAACLMQVPTIISDFALNIVRLLFVSSGGQDLYNEAMADSYSLGDGSISNLSSIISNAYGNFGILLFFYYLSLKKRNKFIMIGLFISSIISILSNISLGQRGPILEIVLSMIITYFALRKFYHPKVNKIVKNTGIVLLIATIVPVAALTVSRFGESEEGSESSLFFYAGQENLYFNNYGLDNGGIRYGDRTFPFFKRMLGFENVPENFWDRRSKYPNLQINDEVFIGFVGDFTLDFGPFIAPIIFILFTIFVLNNTIVRNGRLLFHQLILLHFVMSLCMLGGMKLYPFSDLGGNLQLIVYVLAFLFFRLIYAYSLKREQR
ncbi:O-antigen polymerase [Flavobacterium denitrificans]|uniref:O-antigen polymerase n=1 Tax=Flavobacterium denitrificans TaxID=281361 RepID=UPI00042427D5|nr:O-antigen polymerase [Flavobacterium denitrificans]